MKMPDLPRRRGPDRSATSRLRCARTAARNMSTRRRRQRPWNSAETAARDGVTVEIREYAAA